MGYAVIEAFVDLQDNNHVYSVGDAFPRAGYDVTLSRLSELMGANNKLGKPLVGEEKTVVVEKKTEEKKVFSDETLLSKKDVEKMQFFALKSLAIKNGIDPEGKKGAELKAEIIEKLNL